MLAHPHTAISPTHRKPLEQEVMMPSVGWLGSRLGNRRLYLLSLGTFVGGVNPLRHGVGCLLAHRLSCRAND